MHKVHGGDRREPAPGGARLGCCALEDHAQRGRQVRGQWLGPTRCETAPDRRRRPRGVAWRLSSEPPA